MSDPKFYYMMKLLTGKTCAVKLIDKRGHKDPSKDEPFYGLNISHHLLKGSDIKSVFSKVKFY